MGTRRTRDARWSASFSAKRRSPGGAAEPFEAGVHGSDDEMRAELWGAERVSLHWRYDGASTSTSFALPDGLDDAIAFRRLLVAAIYADLPADDRRHPIAPGTPAAATAGDPAPERTGVVVAFPTRPPTPAGPVTGADAHIAPIVAPRPDTDPGGAGWLPPLEAQWDELVVAVEHLDDFDQLVAWRMADLCATKSKRNRARAGGTLGGYEGELALAASFFQYVPGDPRLADPTIAAHSSMRLDDPGGASLNEADCIGFVDYRQHLNLRTRTANLRAEQAWGRAIEAAERAAAHPGAPLELPVAPAATAEVAGPTTVRAAARTVKSALSEAHAEGRIDTNPWTPRVDKRIEAAPRTHFSDKRLWNAQQVAAIADTMANHTRRGPYVDGSAQIYDGRRYQGFIETAYGTFARPEELIATRLSCLALEGPNPGLVISEAEVNYPLRYTDGDTSRTVVTLKARGEGDSRWVPITPELAAMLQRHVDEFVPEPDLTSADPDRHDPRLFTTHGGAPIDLGDFSQKWMVPVLDELFALPGEHHLRDLRFRHLRHSGITAMLQDGYHYEDVATWAGNSPLVIKANYRGVIDQHGPATRTRHRHGTALAESLSDLASTVLNLGADDAAAAVERAHPELTPAAAHALGRALAASGRRRMTEEEL